MVTLVITIVVALSISAICSVLEACLLSLSLSDIAKISENKPASAQIWRTFKNNIHRPIAVILIINTIAHTIGASISGGKFNELFGPRWIALYSLVFSFVMIQWTEILPKTLGVRFNMRIASAVAVPFRLLVLVLSPLVALTEILNRPFNVKKGDMKSLDAVNELNLIARFASLNNIISTDQESIISRTVGLSSKKARDIMVPAAEMKYLSSDMNLMDALIEAHIHHHTRFPLVHEGNIDDVVGYVNFKDIVSALQINPADPSLKGIARPIVTVYENETFPVFFKKLLTGHQHIVIVKNMNDKVVGIITLEDIIEEIVGEIEDEYDVLPVYCYPIAVNRYITGGGITIRTINEKMDVELPFPNINVHTWLVKMIERVPKSGEKFTHGTITFMVKKIRRTRVYEAIVEKNA